MLSAHIDNINDLAVVECEGRMVGSEAAFRLREAVTSQTEARIVVLDLSEVYAIGGGGLGMLVYLQQWTRDHGIQFKLFNPSRSVRELPESTYCIPWRRNWRRAGRGGRPHLHLQPRLSR